MPRPAVVAGNQRPGGPEFGAAVAELALGLAAARGARPELTVDDEPPPRRLAPQAVAFAATVESAGREIGWGRFVLLYDPAGQDGWVGSFRVIAYVRADLEPDIAQDMARLDIHVQVPDGEHQSRRVPTTVAITCASARIPFGVVSASTRPWWRATMRSE